MKFTLNTDEAELLIHFETSPGLEPLANLLGRDPTVISKQLKRISSKGDFLTKSKGRWTLTEAGKRLNQLSKDYIFAQNKILKSETKLNLGGTREFTAHVLAPHIDELTKVLETKHISLQAREEGVEEALLTGLTDIGFDCGRPYSPDIGYKQVVKEPIIPVATPDFVKKMSKLERFTHLENFEHILCERLYPDRVSRKEFNARKVAVRTNDISTAKSLCLKGAGWALLPRYCIQKELKARELKPIQNFSFDHEKFGVWYLKSRKALHPQFENLIGWLKEKNHLFE